MFGRKHSLTHSDCSKVVNEFNRIYTSIYEESTEALQKAIRKVERKFDKSKASE